MAPLPRGLQLTTGLVTLLLPALQPPLDRDPLGLGCCDFARHYFRNRGFFLFLQVLRWFTSLSLLVPGYVFTGPYYGFTVVGFPIRTSPSQSLLAARRGLSQLATSFITYQAESSTNRRLCTSLFLLVVYAVVLVSKVLKLYANTSKAVGIFCCDATIT